MERNCNHVYVPLYGYLVFCCGEVVTGLQPSLVVSQLLEEPGSRWEALPLPEKGCLLS